MAQPKFLSLDEIAEPAAPALLSLDEAVGDPVAPEEPGLLDRLKSGYEKSLLALQTSLTDDPGKIAEIASEYSRKQGQLTPVQERMAAEIAPYVEEAQSKPGFAGRAVESFQRAPIPAMAAISGIFGATEKYGPLGAKRAGQLAENPREAAGLIAEQLPNSAPGLVGTIGGAVAGGRVAGAPGAAVGGIGGGTLGGYAIEQGSSMLQQILEKAAEAGIDTTDPKALESLIRDNYDTFLPKSRLKGIGTAGTDAVLNTLTFGVAGAGERAIVDEARRLTAAVAKGEVQATEAATKLAELQARQAARTTIPARAARGTAVTASEMAGEGFSEAVGQQLAYGEVNPLEVVDESLLGLGQGAAMAGGRGAVTRATGALGVDTRSDVDQALGNLDAAVSRQRQDVPPPPPPPSNLPSLEQDLGSAVNELTNTVDPYLGITNATSIDEAINAATQAVSVPLEDMARMTLLERQAMIDRQFALTQQAQQAGTEFDRQNALDQARVALPQAREGQAQNYADLTPMDERQAANRLTVLRDQVAREGGNALELAVVPHPAQPGRFAIGTQALPSLDVSTAPAAISTEVAQGRLETAALTGQIEQRRAEDAPRQAVIDNALRNVEARGGVASPAEARIFQEAGLGQPYDRVDPSLAPPLSQDQQLTQATGIALDRAPRSETTQQTGATDQQLQQQENQARSDSRMQRLADERAAREADQQAPAAQPGAPAANDVISALVVPGRERSAEQVALINQAQNRYDPTDFSILQRAAMAPFQLSQQERVRLRELRNQPQTPVAEQGVAQTQQLGENTETGLLGSRVAERLGQPTAGRIITSGATLSTQRNVAPGSTVTINDGETAHNATVVDPSRLGNTGRLLTQVGRIFGKRLVVFESDSLQADGFVLDGDDQSIYVNASSQMSPLAVFGHEMTHLLKRDNAEAYAALEAVVQRNLAADGMERFTAEYGADANIEELTSDLVGNRFQEADFWNEVFNEVAAQNPENARGVVTRMAAALQKAVNAFLRIVRQPSFQADQYVQNLEQIKAAVREAAVRYAQSQRQTAMQLEAEIARAEGQVDLTAGSRMGDNVSNANTGARNARFSDARRTEGLPATTTEDGRVAGQDGRGEIPSYGQAREGAVSVVGRHYSTQPRQALSGSYYGRGLKGAERNRLDGSADPRLRQRVYFYVDQGSGIRPEAGVGGYAHEVRLDNVYDPATRLVPPQADANAFESAVLNAGFDGYLAPFGNNQAAVVLLGPKHKSVPVRAMGQVASAPAPQAAAPTTLKKSLLSRELDAVDVASIPGARVRMGNLEIPADQVDAANAELERIGSASRFSRTRGLKPEVAQAVEGIKKVAASLTETERAKLRKDTGEKLVAIYKALPSSDEIAAVAYAGKAKRGWYRHSVEAIQHIFGEDGWRFAGLLSATSPQTSVEVNLENTLRIWKNWIAAGRPTDDREILAIMGRSVQGVKGEDSVLGAWRNNSYRALKAPDFADLVLSGPKVDSFMRNLNGDYVEVTNDAWMANYALVDQTLFSGSANKAGTEPGKGAGYLAMSAKTREAAKKLGWQPAEVQETVWSWAMSMLETMDRAGETRGAVDLLQQGALTDDVINATPDFRTLFRDPRYADILEAAGYGERVATLPPAVRDEDTGAAPFNAEKMNRLLADAGLRLEFLQRQRRTNVQVSWEARPGESTGILPGMHTAPLEQQQQYLADIFAAIERAGFTDKMGFSLRNTLFGPSAWEGKVLAGAQTLSRPGVVADNQGGIVVDPETRKKLELVASVLGLVLRQEGVYWHYPVYKDGKPDSENGIEINFGRSLSNPEMQRLYAAISKRAGHSMWAPANTPTGVRILNFTDTPHKEFHRSVRSAITQFMRKFDGDAEFKTFSADGDAIENNWKEAPDGQTYRQRIGEAKRPDLLEWAAGQLQTEVDAVNRDYSQRFGWGAATLEERDQEAGQARLSRTRRDQAQAEYAEVEARYRDTDQWLKAPNGQATNLTERQWVQVRTPSFKAWFGDWENDPANASKALDENGEPKVYYHGSTKAGFTEFDTDGGGKTRGTGAFFADNFPMARGYSGSRDDAPIYTAEQLLDDPSLIDGLEIEEGVLVEVTNSYNAKTFEWYADEDSALADLELEEGEQLVSKPGYRMIDLNGYEITGTKEEILDDLESLRAEAPGVYAVFLNVRDMVTIDWKGNNWDDGPKETVWELQDEDGDVVDWVYSQEDADAAIARDPSLTAEEREQAEYESTDDAARQGRDMDADGVLIKNVYDTGPYGYAENGNVLVVYKPENIKSAEVNTGAFDPANPDITASRRRNIYGQPAPLATWTVPTESKMDDALYILQDKMVDTKRVVQAVKEAIGDIDDKWNPYLQEELFHGRTAKETKDFLSEELRPLLEDMQSRGVGMAELEEFLHNRHAEERNNQIAKVNPDMPDGGSGIATADARAYLANLDPAKRRAYEALAQRVDAITAGTRKLLVDSGLETDATIAAWEGAYSQYVPLMREDLDFSSDFTAGTGTGQGYSVRGGSSKRATGSKRDVVDVLANVARQRENVIVRAEKNRVATAVYGLAASQPNTDFWLAVNPDAIKDPVALEKELIKIGLNPLDAKNLIEEPKQTYIDPRTGLVSQRINPALRGKDNVLAVRIDGQDRYVFFNGADPRSQRMVAALKNLDADRLGRAMGLVATATRWFASVNTQYNPIFGVVNFTRDTQAAVLQLSTTPIADKKKEVLANVIPALRGIYADVRSQRRGRGPATGVWAQLWEEFQQEGGQTGFRDQFSRSAERAEALQRELNRISEGKTKQFGRAMFDWLSDYNETMENAVRLSAYKAALDKGMTKAQAASVAKNLTVNFNRKGQIATQAGAWYAFFNAAMQGTARLVETLKGPAGKKIMYGGLLLGTAQAVMLAAAGFDEDEPPSFVKERNLIIPTFDGKYISIPMPLGYNVIPNTSRVLTEFALSGWRDPSRRIGEITGAFLEMFNPIGNAGWSVQTLAPTIFDPLVALKENQDYTGKPIAKEDRVGTDPSPGYTRAKDTASWFSKQLSYYLNLASGGTKYQQGLISPTPDQIDYLIGQVTGGVGRELMKVEQTVTSQFTGEELPPYKIPLVGRFYGDSKSASAESSRFYANITRINGLEREVKGRRENRENAAEFIRDNPEARLVNFANRVDRDVQQLRQRRRELIDRGASKESVKIVETQITNRMKLLNDRVKRLREQEATQ